MLAEGISWKSWKGNEQEVRLDKLACLWDAGVYSGVKAATGDIVVGNRGGVWFTRTVRRMPERERWARSNLYKIVGAPWGKNEDDRETDGEKLKGRSRGDGELRG